jgi:putative two-component system response regulator
MNVLILDDNEINVALLNHVVTRAVECETNCFTNSPEALRWCLNHTADLIYVDYMMPDLNGLEFIQRFRDVAADPSTPIVMITADNDRRIRYRALELGASDFLNKPIDHAELVARTKNMLQIRQHHRELVSRADWLADEVRKATHEIVEREKEVIFRLARAAEYRSPETGLHVMRVALYSKALAKHIGMSVDDQDLMFLASPMHDIGKVATPDDILFKGDKLDIYEFAQIKLHTLTGYEIMHNSKSRLLQMASEIALCHHEKFDGTGYPRGLKGSEIPLSARICTVADVFDALTSERPYKQAWSVDEALKELDRLSGTHFDPDLVASFRQIVPNILEIREKFSEIRSPSIGPVRAAMN